MRQYNTQQTQIRGNSPLTSVEQRWIYFFFSSLFGFGYVPNDILSQTQGQDTLGQQQKHWTDAQIHATDNTLNGQMEYVYKMFELVFMCVGLCVYMRVYQCAWMKNE